MQRPLRIAALCATSIFVAGFFWSSTFSTPTRPCAIWAVGMIERR